MHTHQLDTERYFRREEFMSDEEGMKRKGGPRRMNVDSCVERSIVRSTLFFHA